MRVSLKRVPKKSRKAISSKDRWRDPHFKETVAKSLHDKLQHLCINEESDTYTNYESFRNTVLEATKGFQGVTEKRQSWMTDEILRLLDERRQLKGVDADAYREKHLTIKKEMINAYNNWWAEQCAEVESAMQRHDSFAVHKKVKSLTGMNRKKETPTLIHNGAPVLDIRQKLTMWAEYIEALFSDDTRPDSIELPQTAESGPEITKSEIKAAIRNAKNGKAPGPDDVQSEILKLIEDDDLDVLVRLFNRIYNTGSIPTQWLGSTFITLPKKARPKACSEYRTISLMSHVLKVFLKVIHARIYRKCEDTLSDTQFGFRNGFGTRDALFCVRVLSERCLDMNRDLFVCFIDYEKAFDRVQHEKLIQLLVAKGLDSKDIRIIANLYWGQTSRVRVDDELTEPTRILRGVRQGCILSPLLFNIYAEEIFKAATTDTNAGILVNGECINNIRYADDTALISDSLDSLQELLDRVNTTSNDMGLRINVSKTKFMVVTKNANRSFSIRIGNEEVERVAKFKYLGCWMNEDGNHVQDIRVRIEMARSTFFKMNKVLCNRDLSLNLRMRIVRCYIFSVLLYGVESWTLTERTLKRLEAFEMWIYRRILKISWRDKVTNIEVLQRMKKKLELLNTIKQRKLCYFGHVMRNEKYRVLQLIVQGKIAGKRSVGRRRHSWLKNLRDWFGCSTTSLFRAAASKVRIAMMLSNLR